MKFVLDINTIEALLEKVPSLWALYQQWKAGASAADYASLLTAIDAAKAQALADEAQAEADLRKAGGA